MEYVSDLRSNGIPLATWFHTARNIVSIGVKRYSSPLLFFTHNGLEGDRTHLYPVQVELAPTELKKPSFVERADQRAAELLRGR